jgi:hypothetical protein
MKPLTISDADSMILAIQDEIRRTEESRYDHRLHAILLVAQGNSCGRVAQMLGDGGSKIILSEGANPKNVTDHS